VHARGLITAWVVSYSSPGSTRLLGEWCPDAFPLALQSQECQKAHWKTHKERCAENRKIDEDIKKLKPNARGLNLAQISADLRGWSLVRAHLSLLEKCWRTHTFACSDIKIGSVEPMSSSSISTVIKNAV
jgi:hypothetical protein